MIPMNLDYTGLDAASVALTDYRLINPTLAKVVIATTGKMDKGDIEARLVEQLQGLGAPVRASFRTIAETSFGAEHVGFIRANREVRSVSEQEIRASYTHMVQASNILMNNEDESLWQLKKGAGGHYLARHGTTDLRALVEAAAVHNTNVHKLSKIMEASAATGEYVSWVTPDGDTDYGFVLATNVEGTASKVLAQSVVDERIVTNDMLIGTYPVVIPKDVRARVLANINPEQKRVAKAYWGTLFSYAPDYAAKLQKFVEDGTSL